MVAKNTTNAIGNAVQNTGAAAQAPAQKSAITIMNSIVMSENTQKIIQNSLKENAGAFTASVLDLYNSDKYLQSCDPKQVMGECLKAVSLKLPINKQLGFAYIIPYKGQATFQLGYKGMIQLCMRSGAYRYINAGEVYEGELRKIDKLTGEIDINGEATSDKIVGYFAFIETLNGYRKALYWTREKVISHAQKYSQSYRSGSAIWKDNFHEMATKTVLRNLLSHSGLMSVDMINAISLDSEIVNQADQIITGNDNFNGSGAIEGDYTVMDDSEPMPDQQPEEELPDCLKGEQTTIE